MAHDPLSSGEPSRRISRRQFLRVAGATLGGAASLLAIAPSAFAANPAAPARTAAAKVSRASGQVVILTFPDPTVSLTQPILADWGAKNGIDIKWELFPYDTFYEKAVNDAQAKSGAFDIYALDDPWMPQFGGGGFLTNLTTLGYVPDDDMQKNSMDLGYWPPKTGPRLKGDEGKEPQVYAIPWIGDVTLGFWRTDILDHEPASWDEVLANAKDKTDASKELYGYLTTAQSGNPVISNWWPMLQAYGGEVVDDKWNVVCNSDAAIAALQRQLDLQPYGPAGMTDWAYTDLFASLDGGHGIQSIIWTGFLKDGDDPAKSQIAQKWQIDVPFKQVRPASEIGLWISGISAASKNQEASYEVMKFWASAEAQIAYARAGGTPVRRSAYADAEALSKWRYLPGILNSLDNSVPRPRTDKWAQIENLLGTRVNEAMVAKGGAKDALDKAAVEIKDLLSSAGYYS
jgi:multiple sugar transport system substrate-binding protein